jgi:hypothetical protein
MDSIAEIRIIQPPIKKPLEQIIEESIEKPIEKQIEKPIKQIPYEFKYREFLSFNDAYKFYNINPKTFHLKIIYSPHSFESMFDNGNIIRCIGTGMKSAPGYPCGNQILDNQMQLINHFLNIGTIDVFYKNYYKKIVYMGRYGYSNYKKKLTHSGFAYFEFTLSSYQPRDRYKVFIKPNIPLSD